MLSFISNQIFFDAEIQLSGFLVVTSFYIFGIAGIVGMFRGQLWGYICIYLFIPISFIGLGISVIPFVVGLIHVEFKEATVIVLSVLVLITTAIFNILKFIDYNKGHRES